MMKQALQRFGGPRRGTPNRRRWPALCAGAAVLLALASAAPLAQAAQYESKSVGFPGTVNRMSSASYTMTVTSAPVGGATGTCPSGTVASWGFWSLRGPMTVPVRLMVHKNAAATHNVDLAWTGQASEFEIYRSTSPIGLVEPHNRYDTTAQCQDTDENAGPFDILYYRVMRVEE